MKKLNKNNKGFSLVELLVVIAIMVVLVGVIAPTLLGNIEKSRVASDVQSLDAVASAIQNTLGTESAYTEAVTTYKTPHLVTNVVKATVADSDDAFIKVLHEYLSTIPTMKGSSADSNKMYFCVNENNGQVTVWIPDGATAPTAAPTGTASGDEIKDASGTKLVLRAKNTNYIVIR